MNKTILMGRITKDVEVRQTPNGVNVARFSLAVPRRFAKEGQPQADFIECVAWRQQADFIKSYFQKGRMIAIVGSLQSRSWDDQDGKKRYATEVVVEEAYFCGDKATGTKSAAPASTQAAPAQAAAPAATAESNEDIFSDLGDVFNEEDLFPGLN